MIEGMHNNGGAQTQIEIDSNRKRLKQLQANLNNIIATPSGAHTGNPSGIQWLAQHGPTFLFRKCSGPSVGKNPWKVLSLPNQYAATHMGQTRIQATAGH
mmetsp:Transcript_17278/g.40094  ORF Transcript_17278/g.40094 Transcript_17278/m.40094 type:complete len:100 (+) Transcript_17278:512-811(+)